ncbi:hypothetical protein FACS189490_10210 [Clostridia bacterium]|nr:hypothetical protein FACS189490_10210 [Clostridia bacterium]
MLKSKLNAITPDSVSQSNPFDIVNKITPVEMPETKDALKITCNVDLLNIIDNRSVHSNSSNILSFWFGESVENLRLFK